MTIDMPSMRLSIAKLLEETPHENRIDAICDIIRITYRVGRMDAIIELKKRIETEVRK